MGLTISKLARISGVPQPTIHGWATGRQVKKLDQLIKVCSVLEIGLYEILFDKADPYSVSRTAFTQTITGKVRITIEEL